MLTSATMEINVKSMRDQPVQICKSYAFIILLNINIFHDINVYQTDKLTHLQTRFLVDVH